MRRLIILFCGLLSLSVAAILASTRVSSEAQDREARERIFYISFQPGNLDIYYFAKPGSVPRRLTEDFGLDYNATLSPDGRWVVFTSERRGNPNLYAIDLKNSGDPRLLIDSEFMEDQAAISPDGKTFAFVSTLDGNADIFTLPFDPTRTQKMEKARNLTHDPGGDFRPAFSPNGKVIAFSSDRDTPVTGEPAGRQREGEIYVMDSEGKHLRRLTNSPGWDGSPAWSKDGRIIFFYSTREKQTRIWAMDADGNSPRPLSPPEELAVSPALTLEGRVAYASRTGTAENLHWKIMSIKPDGSDERPESDTANDYYKPVFDPITGAMLCHGTGPLEADVPEGPLFPGRLYLGRGPFLVHGAPRLVHLPDRELELYPVRGFSVVPHPHKNLLAGTVMPGPRLMQTDVNGRGAREITSVPNTNRPWLGLSWSRDGEWVAYTAGAIFSPPKAEADIWKIHPDGTGAMNLTPNSPGNDAFPSFSGDGRRIVFRSGRTGNFNIYIMNSNGTSVKNLTNDLADNTFPAFSPLNDEVAFSSNREGEVDPKTGNRTFEIYTLKVSPDGTPGALRRLTFSHGQNAHPQYSPDGQWLIFTSEQGGINDEEPLINTVIFSPQPYGELYACRLKDGKIFRLTNNKWEDGFPYWVSPAN